MAKVVKFLFLFIARTTKAEKNTSQLSKGDLVLVLDPTTPPVGRYPYAAVMAVKKCNDERVRSAAVRFSDGRLRERDIRKLVLIESGSVGSGESETVANGENLDDQ